MWRKCTFCSFCSFLFVTVFNIYAQDAVPVKFENPNAANAINLRTAQEISDYDNTGKFERGRYYIFTCSISGYSGIDYQLNVGTKREGTQTFDVILYAIWDSRPQWTQSTNGLVVLLLYGNDDRFYVVEAIRNFQVRTNNPAFSFLGTRPSTLQDWLTGTTDERGLSPAFEFQNNSSGITITRYNGTEREVNIPEKINDTAVTAIGDNAFRTKNLTGVTIPASVSQIGKGSFYSNKLTNINIPNGVITISEDAFSNNELTNVMIPASVTKIEKSAFAANRLTNVSIPVGVMTIGGRAFSNNRLSSVTIPEGVISIEPSAFYTNELTSVSIPKSVSSIGESAFERNKLLSVIIPDGIISIERSTFSRNELTNVSIPESVRTIKDYAFSSNRQLWNITIGNNVDIDSRAFENNFLRFYNSMTKKAGIYTFDGKEWSFRIE